MSETKNYRKFTAAQKTEIVLASLRANKTMTELCREHDVADSLLRKWRDEIAARLDCGRDVVSQALLRAAAHRLEDRPRRAAPRSFPPEVRAEVIAMACALPAEHGVPLSRWSASELAREAVTRGICEQTPA